MDVKQLIRNKDFEGIKQALSANPDLANEGLPYDEMNSTKAHPLHRICDEVFNGAYTDEESVRLANIFLEHGAKVDGNGLTAKKDTPLIAASSLHADSLAFLYIDNGADIYHAGTHGGTALHWAAWCGRDKVVKRLIEEGAEINKLCIDFTSTPLFWAIHGLKNGGDDKDNRAAYLACARLLAAAGADKNLPNSGGKTVFDLLDDDDEDFKKVLS